MQYVSINSDYRFHSRFYQISGYRSKIVAECGNNHRKIMVLIKAVLNLAFAEAFMRQKTERQLHIFQKTTKPKTTIQNKVYLK